MSDAPTVPHREHVRILDKLSDAENRYLRAEAERDELMAYATQAQERIKQIQTALAEAIDHVDGDMYPVALGELTAVMNEASPTSPVSQIKAANLRRL